MAKVDQFLYDLVYYDKENIHPDVIKVNHTFFNILKKSMEGEQRNLIVFIYIFVTYLRTYDWVNQFW